MTGRVMRSVPAALDSSSLMLPVEMREAAPLASPGASICSVSNLPVQTPASTFAPSYMSPRSSAGSSASSSFMSVQSALTPHPGELRRTLTTLQPAPGFTPHAAISSTIHRTKSDGGSLGSLSMVRTQSDGGATQLVHRTVSFSGPPETATPVAVPASSPTAAPATPGTIIRRYGFAPGVPYPPGMGFSPAAKQIGGVLTRTVSFGLGTRDALSRTTSVRSVPEEDGVFSREMMLLFRWDGDGLAGAGLSAEEAGFVHPQPGWLRTQEKPAEQNLNGAKGDSADVDGSPQKTAEVEPQAHTAQPYTGQQKQRGQVNGQRKAQQYQPVQPQQQHHQQQYHHQQYQYQQYQQYTSQQEAEHPQQYTPQQQAEWWDWSSWQQQQQHHHQNHSQTGHGGPHRGKGRGKGKHGGGGR